MLIKRKEENPLDRKVIDNIRCLGIDMIKEAESGHSGVTLGAASILTTLYLNHLKFDINNPSWINRDRFVLSCGHASALLYSVLHMVGFDISLEDLKLFRKTNSKTPGHPEYGVTPGVDTTTGPLGQGIANAVGMAISEKYLSGLFQQKVIDYNTYALVSDGDLMEGISYEACSLAGKLNLNKLILLYDSNNVTLDGDLSDSFIENIKLRFESMNWNYILVNDSEDLVSLDDAINNAKNSNKPTIIEIKSTIGKYSVLEGKSDVHGKVLDDTDITHIKEKLSLRDIPFQVGEASSKYSKEKVESRNRDLIDKWMEIIVGLSKEDKKLFDKLSNNDKAINLKNLSYESISEEPLRVTSSKILNSISGNNEFVIGGSADVSKSTMVRFDTSKNISFGVREHAMGGIANGMALAGLTPVVSTFLVFSDYLKPSIRMACMMNLNVKYVFTHDSISIGEDGPTHQPIEQLVALRSTPNLTVYHPADSNELLGSYIDSFEKNGPCALIISRNKVKVLKETKANEIKNGGYIVKHESKNLDAILISSGDDLHLAIEVSNKLKEKGIMSRVVSMPSIELFKKTKEKYQKEVIPSIEKTFVIQKSSSYSWDQFVIDRSHLFTIDEFGISGSPEDILDKYNFTVSYIEKEIEKLI